MTMEPQRDALAAELIAMADEDQRVRAELLEEGVLFDGYRALEIAWRPATAGALDDVAPGVTTEAVEEAVLAARGDDHELTGATVDPATLDLARALEERHRWPFD